VRAAGGAPAPRWWSGDCPAGLCGTGERLGAGSRLRELLWRTGAQSEGLYTVRDQLSRLPAGLWNALWRLGRRCRDLLRRRPDLHPRRMPSWADRADLRRQGLPLRPQLLSGSRFRERLWRLLSPRGGLLRSAECRLLSPGHDLLPG